MATPEEMIRRNVQAALGKHVNKPVKKTNIFVAGVCKSASRTRSTDLAEVETLVADLPVTNKACAALALVCAHNNTQVREKTIEAVGYEERGIIKAEQMAMATGGLFSEEDFLLALSELMALGVLSIDKEGFYRVALYKEEE